ncbi:MAG: helix-turn-helix transcriptional regulator [Mycobacterium sp.]|uniref:helix-turn-helix transcriptional regulator n=1 Tax=Mycobacterium sp. TaxID=1785 RepID=UPI00389AF885
MDEETDTAAGPRRRRDRLPRNRQRERVLRMVREHGGAIDAVELASRMKLHVTTVRFHLDALCDEGAIERTRMTRDGVGRPRTGYRAVEERLDYRILAEILAMELGETAETRARRAQRAGVQWAGRIAAAQPEAVAGQDDTDAAQMGDALDRGAALATEVFDRMGFDAELAAGSEPSASLSADSEQVLGRERVIRLHACPVRDLARAHPEVGCGLHLGLLQGLVDSAAATGEHAGREDAAVSARLEPFVEPELCIARLAARGDPPVTEVRPRRKRRG